MREGPCSIWRYTPTLSRPLSAEDVEGDVAGPDITAAVAGPELRDRKSGEVDLVAGQDDLVHRRIALGDANRRDAPRHDRARRRDHAGDRKAGVDADGKGVAFLAGAEHVAQDAGLRAVTGELLEQQGRRILAPGGQQRDGPQFFVRLDRRCDMLEEAIGFDQIEPVAQVAPRHRRGNARDRFRR